LKWFTWDFFNTVIVGLRPSIARMSDVRRAKAA
jgi:hypothetical protein